MLCINIFVILNVILNLFGKLYNYIYSIVYLHAKDNAYNNSILCRSLKECHRNLSVSCGSLTLGVRVKCAGMCVYITGSGIYTHIWTEYIFFHAHHHVYTAAFLELCTCSTDAGP